MCRYFLNANGLLNTIEECIDTDFILFVKFGKLSIHKGKQ